MLTYPSDSLPQIVCPMDEHAITPNRFCSAPPHSEPPTPLLPLSSTTPSCAQNGISEHRSSGRLQEIRTPEKQSGAAQKASGHTPTPTERPGENTVSKSKQPRVEVTHVHEEQKQDGFEIGFATEHQNTQKDQESPPNVSAAENGVEQFAVDATKSDMDMCSGLALGHSFDHVCPPKGWVIGPLFQSFKSKMASFTEIVMSPAKLFRANSPPPCSNHPDKVQEYGNGNQQRLGEEEDAQNEITVALKYSKKLSFDEELPTHGSEQADNCAITSPDSVPLQRRPSARIDPEEGSEPGGSVGALLQPSVDASASHKPILKTSSVEEQKSKLTLRQRPLPRKCTGNKSGVKKVTFKTSASKVTKQEGRNSVKPNKADSVCQPDPDRPQPDGDGRKIESLLPPSHLNNLNDSNGRTPMPSLDTQLLDCQLHPETYSAAGLGRAKRGVEVDYHPQDVVKRKRLAADGCTKETQRQKVLNVASDVCMLRPSRRDVVLTNPVVGKPARKRPAVATRANKNGKEMLATINEMVFSTHSESPSDAMPGYSLDQCSGVSERDVKGGSCQVKPSGPGRRLKTRTGLMKPDVNIENGMEVETRMEIASTKAAQLEPLSDALIHPAIKPFRQNTSKRRDANKKPPKRKSPIQSGSTAESDGALFSTSSALSMEPLELTPTGCKTSHKEEMKGLDQPSKRPKRSVRVAVKSSASGGSQDSQHCIQNLDLKAKENQPNEGEISVDPVYFEMTPFEMNEQPVPSPSQPNGDGLDVKQRESSPASVSDEVFPTDAEASVSVSGLRSSAGRVNTKPRRADSQRRKCRRFHSRTRKGEEVTTSVTVGDADLAPASSPWSENDLSRRLLRSYSCPEIPCLRPHDVPWTHSPHHSRVHALHQHQASHTPSLHQAHKALRRARRHTVSSVEVEREIAPLCLRKEVYPSRRSLPCDPASQHLSAGLALSPSASLSALASCFLSSPLAFLSKKVESRGAAASPGTSSHLPSPASSSSPMYPLIFLQRIDSSSAASLEYSISGNPLECEMERRRREEEDDGEDTSSSSHEFDDIALREEKALSDSEIKVVQKHEERGKVSSIRIRKTLPKPQNNLTPMGLPKAVRLKKKEFSLEEIYTNKNFSKPPESRLETIFEVPLNRRNGSESWFGLRRLKRFLEFLDAGEVRKPKKPLVGVGKAGVSSSRTRRGGFHRDEPALSVQDVDSLLCSKLDQLSLWLTIDQEDR